MTSETIQTSRLRTHYVASGPEDGVPVVLVHGNLSTGRFYEHLFADAPERYRLIAPDMRGFGDSEPLPIDATRGLADWADDTQALIEALGISRPVHLAGWSTGGAAIAAFALDREVASLTFIDPVSPYGYGGTHADGTPCFPDWAGTGGGTGAPEFVERLAAGDRSEDGPTAPLNVLRSAYWSPEPPRARGARADAAHRAPEVRDRRRRLPRRLHAVGELARRRARHARDPQRALGQALQLGRRSSSSTRSRRSCGRTAATTSSSPTARRGRWARSGSSARSRAGPARRSSRRSRWWARSARAPALPRRGRPRRDRDASRAPATSRRSTPPSSWSATFFAFLESVS